jgi:hypothetical protein
MAIDNTSIDENSHDFETALTHLLHTEHTTDGDPQGSYTLSALGDDLPAYTVDIAVAASGDDRHPQNRYHRYCLECDWTVSTAEYPREELNRRMIRHWGETGHDIESADSGGTMETAPSLTVSPCDGEQ